MKHRVDRLVHVWSHGTAKARAAAFCKLHKEYKKVFRKRTRVTPDDKFALYDYTSSGYGLLNKRLRFAPKTMEEDVHRRVKNVCQAMHRVFLKTHHRGIVKRGSSNLSAPEMEALQPGATYSDAGFFSTSYDKGFPGPLQWVVLSKTGINVTPYSAHEKEKEILFLPGTLFRILWVKKEGETTTVGMEEI
jgi:hypothetical protein